MERWQSGHTSFFLRFLLTLLLQHGFLLGLESPWSAFALPSSTSSDWRFLLLSPSNVSALSWRMYSRLHHQTDSQAWLWATVGPLPKQLELAVFSTRQTLSHSHRGHPGSPLTTKTLPPTPDTDFKPAKRVRLSVIIDISSFLQRLLCLLMLTVVVFSLISSVFVNLILWCIHNTVQYSFCRGKAQRYMYLDFTFQLASPQI